MRMIKLAACLNITNGEGKDLDSDTGMRSGYRKSNTDDLHPSDAVGTQISQDGRISKGRQMVNNILKVTNSSGNAV